MLVISNSNQEKLENIYEWNKHIKKNNGWCHLHVEMEKMTTTWGYLREMGCSIDYTTKSLSI